VTTTSRPLIAAGLLLAAATTPGAASAESEPITTGSLIREMVDLRRLADFPQSFYRTVQFSSYDRRSRFPSQAGWFANSDGFGGEPIPNFEEVLREPDENGIGEYLICDVTGPGAVVRLWTARIEGTLRVFLDGSSEALYDGPAQDFFQRTYEALSPSAAGPFEGTFSQAEAGYYPLPFAKGLRMEWEGPLAKLHFYQVQVRLYEPGARVTSFRLEDLATYARDIEAVARILADPDGSWTWLSSRRPVEVESTIPAGEKKEILALEGPGAVERLTLKVQAPDTDAALRQGVLHITFDEAPRGQVQAPIGDFFGAAPGINPFQSVPFTVESDGTMTCRFWMPYQRSARIAIENRGNEPLTVSGSALAADHEWTDGRSMHFRARWRVDHDLDASEEWPEDIPYLLARGQGVFVGAAAFIMNPTSVPSSWGNWWGEGDEKVFVDDDRSPSTFGTGSEDYFNYAWSSSRIFSHAFCGQPRNDGPANRGFVTNHRWQVVDAIPFRERFDFFMELFSHEPVPGFSYGRIAYHYGVPEIVDDHMPLTDRDVEPPRLPDTWMPTQAKYTAGTTFFQVEDVVEGEPPVGLLEGPLWAGGRLLLWRSGQAGEELTLTVPVPEDGTYNIALTAARRPDAGSFSASVDGTPLELNGNPGPVELSVPHRTLSRNFKSQGVELAAGAHTLRLRSESPGDIGLDFVWVRPTPQ
jgi:hypothetical protein